MNTKTTKKCVAVLLLAMLTMPAFSQLRFGVRTDVGMYNPSFTTSALAVENLSSFSVGPTLELMIPVVNWGIEASVLYNNHSMTISGNEVKANTDVTNHYLLVPVNVKKKFGLGVLPAQLFATAGPHIGFLLGGDEFHVDNLDEGIRARSFQAGLGFGLGFEVFGRAQVGVQYRLLLTDNYAENRPGVSNIFSPLNDQSSRWFLSASFFF